MSGVPSAMLVPTWSARFALAQHPMTKPRHRARCVVIPGKKPKKPWAQIYPDPNGIPRRAGDREARAEARLARTLDEAIAKAEGRA